MESSEIFAFSSLSGEAGTRRPLEVQRTADGSPTLFVPGLDEHYHSVKGARTESLHIFIDQGMRACRVAAPRVLEVGFGTGLNALLTWDEADGRHRPVRYTTLECYPLSPAAVRALDYGEPARLQQLHDTPWEQAVPLSPFFTLLKRRADFTVLTLPPSSFDVVYMDAFAPEKQPEMWSEARFAQLFRALAPGGILTTYCAKGAVRRLLQAAGFLTERLPGPPGGKREMLRARKPVG